MWFSHSVPNLGCRAGGLLLRLFHLHEILRMERKLLAGRQRNLVPPAVRVERLGRPDGAVQLRLAL